MIAETRANRTYNSESRIISGGYSTNPLPAPLAGPAERRRKGRPAKPENNPAKQFSIPPLPRRYADWIAEEQKPCDSLSTEFIPDVEIPEGESEWQREERMISERYVRGQCKTCPMLALCSREALVVAQTLADWQGGGGRLYGIWGGVFFRGNEQRKQYTNKLEKMFGQMNSGEIEWEPLKSKGTAPSSPSESPLSETG